MSNNKSDKFLRIVNDLKDNTGLLNVHKRKVNNIKGFKWVYSYDENGKNKNITSIHLYVLKYLVISKGLPWKIINESKANELIMLEKSKYHLFDNGCGILFLDIVRNQFDPFNGFWHYKFNNNTFYDNELVELKKVILDNGLPWIVLNEDNAKISLNSNPNFESGIEMVNKIKHEKYLGLFKWCYVYKDHGSFKLLINEDLNILKEEVLKNNFSWKIIDEIRYDDSLMENKNNLEKINHFKWAETGIYRVKRIVHPEVSQGFLWTYRFKQNGKQVDLSSTDLLGLKEKMIKNGFEWIVVDEDLAEDSFKENNFNLKKYGFSANRNKTGVLRVYKSRNDKTPQGFYWVYAIKSNDCKKVFSSVNLLKLKEKVINNGLEWKIVTDELFERSIKENERNIKKYYS